MSCFYRQPEREPSDNLTYNYQAGKDREVEFISDLYESGKS